jgi:hypothetical protein
VICELCAGGDIRTGEVLYPLRMLVGYWDALQLPLSASSESCFYSGNVLSRGSAATVNLNIGEGVGGERATCMYCNTVLYQHAQKPRYGRDLHRVSPHPSDLWPVHPLDPWTGSRATIRCTLPSIRFWLVRDRCC